MLKKKLSEQEIRRLEEWADAKKKSTMNNTEKEIVARIDDLKKKNWKGYRIDNEEKVTTRAEAEEKLKRLKKKSV